MKTMIRLTVLSGLLGLASWSIAGNTSSKGKEPADAAKKTFGICATYDWITEGTDVTYTYVGGEEAAEAPKVNLWSGDSTGSPSMPPEVGEGHRHGQIDGWASLSATPSMDWSAYSKGTLKMHLCVQDDKPLRIAFKSEDPAIGEWWVQLAAGEEKYGLVRGADWSEVAIPLREFTNYRAKLTAENLSRIKDPFVISGGATFVFTQIYLSEK